jgi:hypothetical protein
VSHLEASNRKVVELCRPKLSYFALELTVLIRGTGAVYTKAKFNYILIKSNTINKIVNRLINFAVSLD